MVYTTPTIFVIDDDPSFCRAMERLLRAVGYPVEAYASPTEFMRHRRSGGGSGASAA